MEGGHTHGMWLMEDSSRAKRLFAVRRRIFMGLEEGLRKTADKSGGEVRIGGLYGQVPEEGKAGCPHGGKGTEPLLLV